jgi:hypothetical protein
MRRTLVGAEDDIPESAQRSRTTQQGVPITTGPDLRAVSDLHRAQSKITALKLMNALLPTSTLYP